MRSNVNMNSERGFALMSAALISVLLTGLSAATMYLARHGTQRAEAA